MSRERLKLAAGMRRVMLRVPEPKGKLSDALLQPSLNIEDLDLVRSRDTGRTLEL